MKQIITQRHTEYKNHSRLSDFVVTDSEFTSEYRMNVYQNDWHIRLKKCLKSIYVSLEKHLGKHSFEQLAKDYFKVVPCHSFSIFTVGDQIPDFLKTWKHPLVQPWHIELAQLEKDIHNAFFGADTAPWSLAGMVGATVAEMAKLQLKLTPTTYFRQTEWNVYQLKNKIHKTPLRKTSRYLVHRSDDHVYSLFLTEKKFNILKLVEQNLTLGEILDQYPSQTTVTYLTVWAQWGVISPK